MCSLRTDRNGLVELITNEERLWVEVERCNEYRLAPVIYTIGVMCNDKGRCVIDTSYELKEICS
jgi:hypothetical protein